MAQPAKVRLKGLAMRRHTSQASIKRETRPKSTYKWIIKQVILSSLSGEGPGSGPFSIVIVGCLDARTPSPALDVNRSSGKQQGS